MAESVTQSLKTRALAHVMEFIKQSMWFISVS